MTGLWFAGGRWQRKFGYFLTAGNLSVARWSAAPFAAVQTGPAHAHVMCTYICA